MKKDVIFLLGATGYLGSELVKKLETLYDKIYIGTRKIEQHYFNNKIHIAYCDLLNEIIIPEDVTIIINCAGVIYTLSFFLRLKRFAP